MTAVIIWSCVALLALGAVGLTAGWLIERGREAEMARVWHTSRHGHHSRP